MRLLQPHMDVWARACTFSLCLNFFACMHILWNGTLRLSSQTWVGVGVKTVHIIEVGLNRVK